MVAKWLTEPKPIRPAGFRYFNHIKDSGSKEPDIVIDDGLKSHIALSTTEAKAVAQAIETFRVNDDLVEVGILGTEAANMFMGEMAFEKFSGCLACHEIEPGYGGMSGPELYSSGERLKPAFVYSYIKSPQSFDPKSMMPDKEVGEDRIKLLSRYILALEGDEQ